MRTRSVALGLLASAWVLGGCGGGGQHVAKITAARATRSFASDQPALSAHAVLVGHAANARTSGRIIATNGFDPGRDGFSFENYGFIAGPEIDQHGMRELFGDGVCADAPTDACTLTPAAAQWAVQASDLMINGHCYGFSVTALRFFKHLLSPNQFGAGDAFSLALSTSLQSEIAYGMALQLLAPVQRATILATPTQALKVLENSLAHPSGEAYSLGILKADGSDGHEITPVAIEDLGGGSFNIDVYDNNFPNTTRAVQVDTSADTWRYQGSPNPSDQTGIYNGQRSTNPMQLAPLSPGLAKQPCPFCAGATRGTGIYQVSLAGNPIAHGHLLLTDTAGRRIGYLHGRLVNEIKGARALQPTLNQVWKASPEPVYQLPAGGSFVVTLDGAGATGTDAAAIHVTGPGFGASAANLRPSAGTSDTLVVHPGGRIVTLRQSGHPAAGAPTLRLGVNHGSGGSELLATPQGLRGGELTLGLDPAANRVSLARTGSGHGAPVALSVEQVGPAGNQAASNPGVSLAPGHTARFSLGLVRIP